MTNSRSHAFLLLLLLAGVIPVMGQTVASLSYDGARQLALQAQKPFLLICGTQDCPYTRKTLDEVLQSPPLYYYMQDNFVAGFLDMDQPENKTVRMNYGLPPSTPTFLVFNALGRLCYRYETFMTADQLYDSLIVVIEGQEPAPRIMFNTRSKEVPVLDDGSEFERPAAPQASPATSLEMPASARPELLRTAAPVRSIAGAFETAIAVSEPRLPATQARNATSLMAGLDRYDLRHLVPVMPFGLVYSRVTSREDLDNTLKYLNERWLSTTVRKNDVWVYLTPDTRTPEYTIVLGSFDSEEQAQTWATFFRPIVNSELTPVDLRTIKP